jgi:hypothetical protein
MKIDPKKLRLDGGTQPREKIDDELVAEYAVNMKTGAAFPETTVFYDGSDYWVADGFHRTLAAINGGLKMIDVDVWQGDVRDAILYSCGSNATHGLKRSNEDKRRAVLTLLNDEEWGQWSNERISKRCCVDPQTVANYRSELISRTSGDVTLRKAIRNGKEYEIDPTNIGKRPRLESDPGPQPTLAAIGIPSDPPLTSEPESVRNISAENLAWRDSFFRKEAEIHAELVKARRGREVTEGELETIKEFMKEGIIDCPFPAMNDKGQVSLGDVLDRHIKTICFWYDVFPEIDRYALVDTIRQIVDRLETLCPRPESYGNSDYHLVKLKP